VLLPPSLTPEPGERGVLTADPAAAGRRIVRAWDLFLAAVEPADQTAPTRSRGRPGRAVLLPLGAWPQTRSVAQIVDDAQAGRTAPAIDLDAVDDAALAANAEAGAGDVRAALARARDEHADFVRRRCARWRPPRRSARCRC
jgi:hypothetical protein